MRAHTTPLTSSYVPFSFSFFFLFFFFFSFFFFFFSFLFLTSIRVYSAAYIHAERRKWNERIPSRVRDLEFSLSRTLVEILRTFGIGMRRFYSFIREKRHAREKFLSSLSDFLEEVRLNSIGIVGIFLSRERNIFISRDGMFRGRKFRSKIFLKDQSNGKLFFCLPERPLVPSRPRDFRMAKELKRGRGPSSRHLR